MAKIETMTHYGGTERTLNIEKPVGDGVKSGNLTGDVMLIQAFLRYIWEIVPLRSGLKNNGDVPNVSGKFDEATKKAINHYQQTKPKELLKLDGRIDPAHYSNRNITTFRLMTITNLHTDAVNASLMLNHSDRDYISGMTRRFPQLLQWLK